MISVYTVISKNLSCNTNLSCSSDSCALAAECFELIFETQISTDSGRHCYMYALESIAYSVNHPAWNLELLVIHIGLLDNVGYHLLYRNQLAVCQPDRGCFLRHWISLGIFGFWNMLLLLSAILNSNVVLWLILDYFIEMTPIQSDFLSKYFVN